MSANTIEPPASGGSRASFAAASPLAPDSAARAEALAIVARLLQGPLLRYLSKRTGSLEEAKDVLQEAYARVLAVQRADAIQSLDRYVWRSALNILSDCRRSSRNRERLAQALSARPEPFAPSAETVADARERLTLVSEAVHELPLRCQEAFLLRIVRCLPFEDVGQEMRISSRMAKIYVARGLEYLSRRLDPADPERGARSSGSRRQRRFGSESLQCLAVRVRSRVARGCAARQVFNKNDPTRSTDRIAPVNTVGARPVRTAPAATTCPSSGDLPMKFTDATLILKALIEGHEPESDVPLPGDSVIHRPDVLRALLTGVTALERAAARDQRRALLPDNVGRTWAEEEEMRMVEAFKAGESPELIARKHRRTLRAIESRLVKMGLITEADRTTHGGFPVAE